MSMFNFASINSRFAITRERGKIRISSVISVIRLIEAFIKNMGFFKQTLRK